MKCVSMSGFKCYIQLKPAPEKHRAGLQNGAEKVAEQLFCLVFFPRLFLFNFKAAMLTSAKALFGRSSSVYTKTVSCF